MRASRLLGSDNVNDILETVTSRSTPATPAPALAKALRTESSRPNSRKAASTDNSVKMVRVWRRNMALQIRWKYFTPATTRRAPPGCPCRGAACSWRIRRPGIVRHHDDGLVVLAVQLLQQA